MNIMTYFIVLEPKTAFGTPLKGDTLFGQFCWQIAEDPGLVNEDLNNLISKYTKSPFIVFSSAWPVIEEKKEFLFALPRPELPMSFLGSPGQGNSCEEKLKSRKENKAKKWFLVPQQLEQDLSWKYLINDEALFYNIASQLQEEGKRRVLTTSKCSVPFFKSEQQHNTINRNTMTTGKGMFAPYVMTNTWYMPGMKLAVFLALDQDVINIEQVLEGLKRIGDYGFGRDASTGLGRFEVLNAYEIAWPRCSTGQPVFTLGPCIPEKGRFHPIYFKPFIRFGRHGAQLLHTGRPFKNPVVMADEGAVLCPKTKDTINLPWVGIAANGVSKAMEETVTQGYTLALPLKFNLERRSHEG